MIILIMLIAIPLSILPFLLLYFIIRLAVKHSILDTQKGNNNKSVYKNGYRYKANIKDDDKKNQ